MNQYFKSLLLPQLEMHDTNGFPACCHTDIYQKKDDIKCNSTGRSEFGAGGMSLALRGGFVGVCIAVTVWREGRRQRLGKGC